MRAAQPRGAAVAFLSLAHRRAGKWRIPRTSPLSADAAPPQLLQRQKRIHRTRPEALQVEGHKLEPQVLEDTRQFRGHRRIQRPRQLLLGDLDAHNLAVMPHPNLAEAQRPQRVLTLLHRAELLAGHRTPILDTRRQARRRRLIPDPQPRLARQLANLLLRPSPFEQRSSYLMLGCRFLPGPEVPLVIQVDSVRDGAEPPRRAKRLHQREQLVLAVKAARPVIPQIFLTIHLRRVNDLHRDALLPGEGQSVVELSARQAGRIRDHRQHLFTQHLMGKPRQKRRIDASRVSHQRPAIAAQLPFEQSALRLEFRRENHVLTILIPTGARRWLRTAVPARRGPDSTQMPGAAPQPPPRTISPAFADFRTIRCWPARK